MNRLLLPGLLLLLSVQFCAAQSAYRIKGHLIDTLTTNPGYLSAVTLLRAQDTVIENFTRADDNGVFSISAAKPGKYLLLISHPGYVDYTDLLYIKDTLTDLDTIVMLSKEHMLKEFVFTQQVAAIKIKGDTTEYMADSFMNKAGATVEDLLKKLPGIQVDKNGKITAQGQTVEKVLVDGEEFFSDDPKVVTQGLASNVVEKVQVFDKKSDQAEFTGIDDGEKTRTINLQLKENMKKGLFGKADGGMGTDNYYQEQLMLNAFRGKRQIAGFGIASNTDKVGLGWNESEKYGGADRVTEMTDDGYYTIYSSGGDDFGGWNGTYNGDGLPKVMTGGLHFADKWNHDIHHASASYRYALQQVKGTGNNSKIYTLSGDSSRVNTENKTQLQRAERNKVSGLYEWKIDSLTSLKMTAGGEMKRTNVNSVYHTETYNIVGDSVGEKTLNDRDITSASYEQSFNADVILRRKFLKKGRSLSVDLKETYKDIKGDGRLISAIYRPGTGADSTDQRKENASNDVTLYGKAVYTEPISKVAFIEGNYALSVRNSTASNLSFDNRPGATDAPVDSFSSDFRYNITTQQGGLSLKFVMKQINMSFGSNVSNAAFLQTDHRHGDTSRRYDYFNIFPKANFSYKISKQTSLRASYNGSTRQPNINQVQPLNQNTDPLNISVGNPGLKQEFNNNMSLNFNNYKVLSNTYLYVGVSGSLTDNAISTEQEIRNGVNYTRYINVDGNRSMNWWGGYDFKIKKTNLQLAMNVDGEVNRIVNVVNGMQNISTNNAYTFNPSLRYEKEEKYEFRVGPGVTYNNNKSTINVNATDYWVLNGDVSGDVYLPKNFEIGTSATMMFRQKTVVFTQNNSIIRWNAYVSKKFRKKKDLMLKLYVFDILNQNLGYTREAKGNVLTQNNYTTIRRYGMLSLIWNFNFSPGAAPAATDDDD
ncbi:MAG: TonB-dependent receptor [Taibaiella sp.]|nr:TonB-dependent receptor [Taibaiella sp.]